MLSLDDGTSTPKRGIVATPGLILRLVFTQEQLSNSLRAAYLEFPVLRAVAIMDVETLHSDILSALPSDPIAQVHLTDPSDSRWSTDEAGFLRLDSHIYVPDLDDLRLRVLRYRHDHPLAGYFGQNRTLELIRREYTWPGLWTTHSLVTLGKTGL